MLCKAAHGDEAGPRTYEICLTCSVADQLVLIAGLKRYGRNRIIDHGLVNYAVVTGLGDAVCFVVTDGQPNPNALRDWKHKMNTPESGTSRTSRSLSCARTTK